MVLVWRGDAGAVPNSAHTLCADSFSGVRVGTDIY